MARSKSFRPRTLSSVFGAFFLVMAILAYYAGATLGYHYNPDLTRWTYTAYLLAAAVFLAGIGYAALASMRYLDARIDAVEGLAGSVVQETIVEETMSEGIPPPLEEVAAKPDHVDRDIDELLVSLQQMEDAAETEEVVEEPPAPGPVVETTRTVERSALSATDLRRLELLKRKRDGIGHFFAGPALAAIGIIGISAAMLPGSDAFLQSYANLNTTFLLGIGYSFVGVAAYLAASVFLMVRNR